MFNDVKCLDIPRPVGSILGLLAILIMVCIQLSFLSIQLVQGIVYLIFMPMAPVALSWVVNHLYATPIGRIHVWVFQTYKKLLKMDSHSQPIRINLTTELVPLNSSSSSQTSKTSSSSTTTTDVTKQSVGYGEVVIHSIACLMDNYCYLLVDTSGAEPPYPCCIIDASEHVAIIKGLNEIAVSHYEGRGVPKDGEEATKNTDGTTTTTTAATANKQKNRKQELVDGFSDVLRLEAILSTHRHWDHTHGNKGILANVKSCTRVYGGRADDVPECTHPLDDCDVVTIGNMQISAIATPCHTRGSLVYKIKGQGGVQDALFTGDTLFTGGCGAPFEGNQHTMSRAFQRIWLESSPGSYFFPGHEYAEALLPGFFKDGGSQPLPNHPDDFNTLTNQFWQTRRRRRFHRPPMPTIPVTVEVEMAYNPYFNSLHSAADVLAHILRRQCMKYSVEMQKRTKDRIKATTSNLSLSARSRRQVKHHKKLPCPPNIDEEYWEALPIEMQEEMLMTLKQKVAEQLNQGNTNQGHVESNETKANEETTSSNIKQVQAPFHFDERSDVSLDVSHDSGFYGGATSVAGAAALQQQQPIKTPQLAPPSGGKGALRPPSGDFERVDSGGDDSSIDLIGGAPSAALNDSDADFAQIGSGGGLVTTQFEFGGAYNYEVTLEQLMIALGVLSAGGDRVEVKNIYRALTTLGSHEGTGMCGSKRRGKGGEEGWRGMGDDEAKMLIDSFNYPQQVLTTTFEEMSTSSESLVVEYAATLFSQVCDRSTIPPPKVFLGLCSKCKLCCPLKKTTPSINGEQIRGESVSVDRDEDGDGGGERSSLSGSASSTSSGHSSHSSGSLVRVSPDPSRDGENGEGVLDGAGGGGKKMNNKDAKKDDKEEVSRSANEPASSMTISSPAIQVQVSGAALSKEVELQSIPSKREMNESLQPN